MTIMPQGISASMLLFAVIALPGCGLLDTNQPNIVRPGDVETPAGAEARRIGAISDFALAKDGDGDIDEGITEGHILLSGLMADEFVLSTTPPTEQEIDQRRVFPNNSSLFFGFHSLHRARAGAEAAAAALRTFSPQPDSIPGIGEMLSLAGFAYIYLGEAYCSGVPVSRLEGDSIVFGTPQPTADIFRTAVARFDAALAEPGTILEESQEIFYLASVGKARALLDLDDFTGAAASVAGVPTDFQYVTEHAESPPRLQNAVFTYSTGFLWSVSDQEGGVGLPYQTAAYPRVPFVDEEDVGLDGSTPQFTLTKYPTASDPIPVADGIEARLIEAEVQLQALDRPGMTATLNALRQAFPDLGLPDLVEPATQVEAEDLLFAERAFWLYATGHRLGDMRRLVRLYQRSPDQVFPTGTYIKGGDYGTDVNLPIPIEELNNPNFSGCLDRNP